MSLHGDLHEAATKEVMLCIGQNVAVKTKAGEEVTRGTIVSMEVGMKVVRVADVEAGADVQVDVDVTRYDIVVLPAVEPTPLRPGETIAITRPDLGWRS